MMIYTLFLIVGADEWELVKEKDGISVYTRAIDGSDFLEFRGEVVAEGSVAALVSILYDIPKSPEWLHQCSFAMTLDALTFEENYIFQTYALPFPVSNREVILHSQLSWTKEGVRLETEETNSYCEELQLSRCEKVRESDLITISRSRGHYLFKAVDEKRTEIIWQQHIEPGGTIPTWLANALVVDIPYNSLSELQVLLKDEKYRDMTQEKLRARWLEQYREHH